MVGGITAVVMSHCEITPQNDHSVIQQLCKTSCQCVTSFYWTSLSPPIGQAQNEVIELQQKQATAPPGG